MPIENIFSWVFFLQCKWFYFFSFSLLGMSGSSIYALKVNQVWTLAIFTSHTMSSPQVIDPSFPKLMSCVQLLKEACCLSEGLPGSAIDFQSGFLPWCRVTTCNYKVRALGFHHMKMLSIMLWSFSLHIDAPWNMLHFVLPNKQMFILNHILTDL